MKHLIMNCVSEICEYEIRMPLLPLAGQSCPQQVSSSYANAAKAIYLKCNILHITGTSNYANGAEGILDNNDPQCWWER